MTTFSRIGRPKLKGTARVIALLAWLLALTLSAFSQAFSPTTLSFPNANVGATAGPLTTTLTNSGASALAINIVIAGANPGDFTSPGNTCGTSLAPTATCTISVTFAPTAAGSRTATLSASAGDTPVALTGTGVGAPAVSFNPSTLAFAGTNVGASSLAQTITVTNSGNAALNVSGVTTSGDFAQTNDCSSVAPSGTCTITVTFKPTAVGPRTGNVSVADNAGDTPQTVSLSGTGNGVPGVSLSPPSLTFPGTNEGASSPAQTVTLMNTGTGTLTVSGVAPSGDFSETNNCSSIAPGDKCTISVTFKPTAVGARTGTLSVTDDANGSPRSVALSGTGNGVPAVSLTPTSLGFPGTNVNASSPAQTVTLTNSGTGTLNVTGVVPSGDFSETNNCSSISPNETCTISVTFKPTAAGPRTGSVTITDNAGGTAGSTQNVGLSGTGLGVPSATLTPGSLSFGNTNINNTSPAQSFTLMNSGTGALSIANISLGGSNPGDFGTSNTCNGSVPAGGNCTIAVTFTPRAAGSLSATLVVTDNSNNTANSKQSSNLFGNGVAVPGASLTPGTLNLGSADTGTTTAAQSFTLLNNGTGALAISNISLGGTNPGDFTTNNNCGASLGAGLSCGISVAFSPKTTGSLSATVTVTDNANNAPGSQQSATATGTGTAVPVASVTPTSVGFGTSTSPQNITLTNTGTGPLTISNISLGGTNANNFSIAANSCSSSLSAGSSCTILVSFTPVSTGSSSAVLTITDNSNNTSGAKQTVSLQGQSLLTIATQSLAAGQVGAAYSAAVVPQGGASPYAWSVASGSLPPGTSLNTGTGLITGTPTTAGSFPLSVKVADSSSPVQSATQPYTVVIAAPTLAIQTASLSNGTVGTAYATTVEGQGGTVPYSWSVASGSLPAGTSLNATSGAISGTPTAAGAATFTIKLTDSGSPAQTTTHAYSVTIAPALLTISGSLPNGTGGVAYSAALVAQGGTTPYHWTIATGSLPAGLTLNASSGAVTGTPTTAGASTFTVKVTDSGSPVQTATQTAAVSINTGLTITTTSLAAGTVGLNYTATLAGQSGTAPLTWSITGLLPAGVTLDAKSGIISGTPTASGTFSFVVKLVDSSSPAQSTTQALTLFINPPVTEPVTPTFSFNGVSGTVTPGADISNATIQLSQASSAEFSGTLSLVLTPSASVTGLATGYLGDAGFVSSTGKSASAAVTIPASTLVAPFPNIDPGTVAGSLAITLTIGGKTAASSTLTVDAAAPTIEANSVQITNVTATGFDVELVATSTTRDLATATYTFGSAAGAQLTGATTFAVNVSQLLSQWFSSGSGLGYGGAFSLTIPFTLSGSASAIQSVSVTLTNSVGTSAAASGTQ